jgi:hypothetical protein
MGCVVSGRHRSEKADALCGGSGNSSSASRSEECSQSQIIKMDSVGKVQVLENLAQVTQKALGCGGVNIRSHVDLHFEILS